MTKLNIDCLNLIFDELQYDKNSLYSCLLVNLEWCNIVVPILWKKYSWNNQTESEKKVFNLILSWLPSSSKQILFNNNIKLPSTILLKPPLFNYISFCEFPQAWIMDKIIGILELDNNDKRILVKQEIYKLFISQCTDIRYLYWNFSQPLSLFPGASTCFSQLYNLHINLKFVNSSALYKMAQICRDLNSLSIYNYSRDLSGLISLIDVQRNLKSVNVDIYLKKGTCEELSKALARKGNTINDLQLCSVNAIQPSFLTSFINLKMISICSNERYNKCEDFREKVKKFQQYLAISEFPDLQSLNVKGLSCFRELALLIDKTKGNISQVYIHTNDTTKQETKNTGMLIKAIANNCPNIEVLHTSLIIDDFIHMKSLLIKCRSLVQIHFDRLNENENEGDKLLDILAKFSPNSLIDITINGSWKYSKGAFEQLFESYRKRTKFDFKICYNIYITESHRVIVRKYIQEGVINNSNLG